MYKSIASKIDFKKRTAFDNEVDISMNDGDVERIPVLLSSSVISAHSGVNYTRHSPNCAVSRGVTAPNDVLMATLSANFWMNATY